MSELNKGFLAAGILHGVILTGYFAYGHTENKYAENFRLDFRLVSAAGGYTASPAEPSEAASPDSETDADTKPASPNTHNPVNAGGDPNSIYADQNFSAISGMIQSNLYYPRSARRQGWEGQAQIHFWIDTSGKIAGAMLRQSSGYDILDQSALDAIRSLENLPRPPVPVSLIVPVFFRLKNK